MKALKNYMIPALYRLSISVKRKYQKRLSVSKLDTPTKEFYVYCLYYSETQEDVKYTEDRVFYIGKAKTKLFPCLRRENKHIQDAYYDKQRAHFPKSRKIRKLLENNCFIMSKILQEYDTEAESFLGEIEWFKYFENKNVKLTNIAECGVQGVGSGAFHPSYNHEIRQNSNEICDLYENHLWSMDRLSKRYNCSSRTIKSILDENKISLREDAIRNLLWLKKDEIVKKYDEGYSLNQLAIEYKEYSANVSFYSDMLKKLGRTIRQTAEYKRSGAWKHAQEIISKYNQGILIKELCSQYNCDCSVIDGIFKDNNVTKRKNNRSWVWNCAHEILELHKQKYTAKQIAAKYNICAQVITKILKHYENN